MKKSIVLVSALCVFLAGCSGATEETDKVIKETTVETQADVNEKNEVSDVNGDSSQSSENSETALVEFINPMAHHTPYALGNYDPTGLTNKDETALPNNLIDIKAEEVIYFSKDVQLNVNHNNNATSINFLNTYDIETNVVGKDYSFENRKRYYVYLIGEATAKDGEWQQTEEVFRIVRQRNGFNTPESEKLTSTNDVIFKGIPEGYHLKEVEYHHGTLYLSFKNNGDDQFNREKAFVKQILFDREQNIVTNRIVFEESPNYMSNFIRSSKGSAFFNNNENGKKVIYPASVEKVNFVDKRNLLSGDSKIHFIDIENMKAYFEDANGLKQLDLVTGEPLYDTNGQDKVVNLSSHAVFVHVANDVLYVYDSSGLAAYDMELNYVEDYYPALLERVQLSRLLPDVKEGRFDYISASDTSLDFWNFREFERVPDLQRLEVLYIGEEFPNYENSHD